MVNEDFRIFLAKRSAGILDNQADRIKNTFSAPMSQENFAYEILAEVDRTIQDFLLAFQDWQSHHE